MTHARINRTRWEVVARADVASLLALPPVINGTPEEVVAALLPKQTPELDVMTDQVDVRADGVLLFTLMALGPVITLDDFLIKQPVNLPFTLEDVRAFDVPMDSTIAPRLNALAQANGSGIVKLSSGRKGQSATWSKQEALYRVTMLRAPALCDLDHTPQPRRRAMQRAQSLADLHSTSVVEDGQTFTVDATAYYNKKRD